MIWDRSSGPRRRRAPAKPRRRQRKQVQQIGETGKVVPQKRFAVEDWPIMDADVQFEGKRILDAAQVPIENL
jgi:hypothetical protein